MVTNLDLIWAHTKKLMVKIMSSSENLLDEKLGEQYRSAFEQLMQVINNPDEELRSETLDDINYTLHELEAAYVSEEQQLKDAIAVERRKIQFHSTYLANMRDSKSAGYNKQS